MRNLLSFLRTQGAAFVVFNLIVGAISMSLLGCGGGSSSQPVTVTVTASATNVDGADKITVTATVANDKAGGGVTWTLSGAGALSGSTTASVTYTAPAATSSAQTATITATSVADSTKSGSASITIPAAPAVTTSSLTAGAVGSLYSQALVVTGGIAPYKWALASGTLPSCISIVTSGNSTTLTGTPTAACAGTYPNISFTVTDSGTPTPLTATTGAFTLTIAAAPAVTFGAATLPNGILNTAYSGSVAATGGAGALTYGLASGSSLPTGLALSAAGAVTGTPTVAGTKSFTVVAADGFGDSATQNDSITINYPTLTVTAATLGTGYVGTNYSQSLAATGGSGSGYAWTLSGGTSLPAGLSLSGAGAITGKPTASGTSNFTVQVKDSANNTATGSFAITVKPGVSVTTASPLPVGYVGASYSQTLGATGGSGTGYTWALNGGASLPTGLTLSNAGVISGKPTASGTTSFGVTVTDSVGNTATATLSVTINSAVVITPKTLPNGYPGSAYPGTTLSATGGSGTGYQWSWAAASGSALPNGLSLSSAGVISGTPVNATNSAVTSNIVVTVTDSASNTSTANFSVTIDAALAITNAGALPSGYSGSSYSQTLTATGGSGSGYTMALTGGTALPTGLTLSGSTISGKPTGTGTTNFKVLLTDSASNSAVINFSITVNAGVSISTGTTLPVGYVNNNYSVTLAATGGSGTGYTWTLNNGSSLPAGLSLSGGAISGKPTAQGASSFGLTVTDSVGNTATATFALTINPGITITPPVLPAGYNGAAYGPVTVSATGGSGTGLTWSWAAAAGSSLPGGLSISSGGVISGVASNTTNASVTSNVVISVSDSAGNAASYSASITIEASLAITTGTTLPTATVNAPYSVTLAGAGGNGVYTWSTTSQGTTSLLSLNLTLSSGGVISGTPTSTGSISVPITVQDGQSHSTSATFSITATNALTVTTTTLPLAYTGSAYSQTLGAAGGTGSGYTWSTTGASNLATFNLTLSSGGVVSGTPASTGTASFTAKVTDSANNTATQALSFVVDAPLSITTSTTLPAGYNGLSYSQTLAASGGSGSGYTWALANGTNLPTGLTLSGNSISGKPTATGTTNFSLKVTDSVGGSTTSSFSITVKAGVSITSGTTLPVGYANLSYSQTLGATGGSGTGYTWTLNNGSTLPSGITLSTGGLLSGKPTATSSSSFGITVTDSVGNTATATFSLTINAGITITPPSLPSGYNGAAYGPATFTATGGSGTGQTWSWAAAGGSSLPGGLSISTSGVVSGTASNATNASQTSNVVVSVSDSAGNTASYNASITIEATLTITTGATLPGATISTAYSQSLAATGGAGGYSWSTNVAGTNSLAALNLTLNSSGLVSGTPASTGTATFAATVTDSQSHTAVVTFSVTATNALAITTTTLPAAITNAAYSQTLVAGGGAGGYTWTTTGASNLATYNLTLSTGGVISGTPTTTGTASFTAQVKDSANTTATRSFSIAIEAPLTISSTSPLPGATVAVAYSQSLAASGGSGGYSWATNVAGTNSLATLNLTLNSSGLVSGTPSGTGTATFAATVMDSESHTASLTFTVSASNALAITTPALPTGYSGVAYSQTLAAAGGSGSGYTWSTTGASNLSSFGLGLSAGGTVSGTPSTTGTVSFTAQVKDSANHTATKSYSFAINAALSIPAASPNPWPSGTVNQSYSQSISASGGSGSGYSWTINGVAVGGGLVLADNLTASANGSQLVVSGTPNAIQAVALNNVQVMDSLSNTAGPVSYSIQINSAGSQVSGQIFINSCNLSTYPTFTVKLMQGATTVQTTSTDGSGNYSFNGVQNGTYSVVPSISGASSAFNPASITNLVVSNGNLGGENFSANIGVTVSGNVTYAGSKTGQVYVVMDSTNCGGNNPNGTSMTEAQLTAGGAFTIRGVPPGSYKLTAGMDQFGEGATNALDPDGYATVTVGTSNVTNAAVTMLDPTVATPGTGPKLNTISPTNLGVVINYGAITVTNSSGNKVEQVAGYTVQWSTTTNFSSTSSYQFLANGTKAPVWILHNGLTGMTGSFSNGTTYYFRARGEMPGGIHTPWTYYGSQATPTGVTIGALAASSSTWTISGAVTVPGAVTPKGPLYVGFFNQSTGQAYSTAILSPSNSSPNAFSFNVPNTSTTYFFFAILDQNNDGLIDVGDVSNTGDNGNNNNTTPTGNISNQNVTLPSANSTATVTTQYSKQINQNGTNSGYQLNLDVRAGVMLPVAVELTAASNPNVVLPVDIGACFTCGNPQYQFYSSIGTPVVGDTYTFNVTYSDGSTGTVVGAVTGVLTAANAPSNLAPQGNSSTSTTPTFTWTYPANASNYIYQFYMNDNNGNTVWQIPGNNANVNGFSSTVPDIVWGTDPTGDSSNTPNVPSLTAGTTYYWQLLAQDTNGNQAQTSVYYIP